MKRGRQKRKKGVKQKEKGREEEVDKGRKEDRDWIKSQEIREKSG